MSDDFPAADELTTIDPPSALPNAPENSNPWSGPKLPVPDKSTKKTGPNFRKPSDDPMFLNRKVHTNVSKS